MASDPTPDVILRTRFLIDGQGRMRCTREANPRPAPVFVLMRSRSGSARAVRFDVAPQLAAELDRLARDEPPIADAFDSPMHEAEYLSLIEGPVGAGPTFLFAEQIAAETGIATVDRLELLERQFDGWTADEIPDRSPIMAIMDAGYPVSICFCARKAATVAEAGVDTAEAFRGRRYAARVTAAWALAIRASGRIPVYSTAWTNAASLSVARQLGLVHYTSDWNIGEKPAE